MLDGLPLKPFLTLDPKGVVVATLEGLTLPLAPVRALLLALEIPCGVSFDSTSKLPLNGN